MTLDEATRFLNGLQFGDTVRVTRDGHTADMHVTNPAHYSDGPHGAYDSLAVTVSRGPGRHAFDLTVLAIAEPHPPGLVISPQTVQLVQRRESTVNEGAVL